MSKKRQYIEVEKNDYWRNPHVLMSLICWVVSIVIWIDTISLGGVSYNTMKEITAPVSMVVIYSLIWGLTILGSFVFPLLAASEKKTRIERKYIKVEG